MHLIDPSDAQATTCERVCVNFARADTKIAT